MGTGNYLFQAYFFIGVAVIMMIDDYDGIDENFKN